MQLDVRLNVGLDAKPLARVASGGELSRLMLALKVVLARHDAIATLVFDEVDQGIGGEVGAQVGGALAEVAERHQVLVITHLPQIAARADRHLVVSKEATGRHRHQRRAADPRRGPGRRDRADAGRCRGRGGAAPRAGAAGAGTGAEAEVEDGATAGRRDVRICHPEGAKRPRDLLTRGSIPAEKVPRCARDDVRLRFT